jgi:hypothetical protein
MSKPQNWSVPGWPAQGTQPGRVPALRVGAVEQVVDVALALTLDEDVRLAEVVLVDKVEEDVIEDDESVDEALERLELEVVREALEEELLLEAADELVVDATDEVLLVLTGETTDETEELVETVEDTDETTGEDKDEDVLELVDATMEEDEVTQPLICFAPHTPELLNAVPTEDLR